MGPKNSEQVSAYFTWMDEWNMCLLILWEVSSMVSPLYPGLQQKLAAQVIFFENIPIPLDGGRMKTRGIVALRIDAHPNPLS